MLRRPILASVTAASVVLSTAMLAAPAGAAPPPDVPAPSRLSHSSAALRDKVAQDATKVADLLGVSGKVTAFVQLAAPSGVDVAKAPGTDDADVKAAAKDTKALAADVVPSTLTASNTDSAAPKRIGTLTNLVSATIVTGDAAKIRALAGNPDVVAIYRVARKTLDNANSDAFTKALATWKETGNTGYGVRIGVIDTGLDYTHADFGGLGTVAAYDEAYGTDGTGPIPAGLFDRTKFIGGYDFAGPTYDADPDSTLPGASDVPHADANPIDSLSTSDNVGHGTHVSGSAAGYGVDGDGKTFTGDYSKLDSLAGWKIGPGTAPEAQIFALKVFGDIGGSTDVTALALDRAADPNNDGDFSDRLDVVNLSLGSDGSPADDPDNIVIDKLSALGTVVAIASGNAGDTTDVGGGPGNAASALTVANSVAKPVVDSVEVTDAADEDLVGTSFGAQNSVAYSGPDVTAAVGYVGAKFDGCADFTPEQKAKVVGKIAYLWWDDNDATRVCGSAARFAKAAAAGAVGVLLPSSVPVFTAGISGSETIPGAQLTSSSTQALLPEIAGGTLALHIGPGLASTGVQEGAGDLLNASSSRGVHGSLGVVKPDVAAPGTGISSAASGTGDEPQLLSGTSMATPHVAGIAALVVRAHPAWSSAQVKAAVMNTATHDVTTGPGGTGLKYGPQRVGSGRVDALDAVQAKVLAYNKAKPALTSVSFGVVQVGASTVVAKQVVTVKNFDSKNAKTFTTSVPLATSGGATITASPKTLTVPKGGSADVTLTLTADPKKLTKQIDATSTPTVSGAPREFVSEAAGRLVLTPTTGPELRVPVRAAPKLVSALTAKAPVFASASASFGDLPVTGRAVSRGGFDSISAPFILGSTSPALAVDPTLHTSQSALASGDIRYVGWSSTVPFVAALNDGADPEDQLDPALYNKLEIGIATQGSWASLALGGSVVPVIDLNLDADPDPEVEAVVVKLNDEDLTVVETFDLRIADPTKQLVGIELVNEEAGDVDTGVFDNSVFTAPINLADANITASTVKVQVSMWSGYASDEDGLVDAAPEFTVKPFAPPFWFATDDLANVWIDGSDVSSILTYKAAGVTSGKLLVLTPQNATPSSRAQVVDIKTSSSTKLTLKPSSTTFGSTVKATATVSGKAAPPTGKVEFRDGSTVLATKTLSVSGKTGTATVNLPKTLKVGRHSVTAVYLGSSAVATSTGSATLTVSRAKPSVSLSTASWKVKANSTPKVTVTVKGASGAPTPTGKVTVKVGGKSVKATLSHGKVTVRLPKVARTSTVVVTYAGSTSYSPGIASHKLTVK